MTMMATATTNGDSSNDNGNDGGDDNDNREGSNDKTATTRR